MNVTGRTRVYRFDGDGYTTYSRGISSRKYVDGKKTDDWVTDWERVQFPKGADIPNKCEVEITKAFEAVSEYKGKNYRKLVVQEYEIVGDEPPAKEPPTDSFEAVEDGVPW